jgi:glycosyltransferase involved in cell wall biosynthesis
MRSGLIPIAAADGGAADLIRNGIEGYLVSADVPDELESALSQLIEHPELRSEMAFKARARADKFPEWIAAMDKAVDFLEGVSICP